MPRAGPLLCKCCERRECDFGLGSNDIASALIARAACTISGMYGTSVVHLPRRVRWHRKLERHAAFRVGRRVDVRAADRVPDLRAGGGSGLVLIRSEEHTSDLKSLLRISFVVFGVKNKEINSK